MWREEGLAERVLDEVAKIWKRIDGGVIVDGENSVFNSILKNLEDKMVAGRVEFPPNLDRQNSPLSRAGDPLSRSSTLVRQPSKLTITDSQTSLWTMADDTETDPDERHDLRRWLQIVGAFKQPRFVYNATRKHFEHATSYASSLPDPSQKTLLFRNRFNLVHQRLLRNESFQTSTIPPTRKSSLSRSPSNTLTAQQAYKLTPIANLLGRSGSSHLLLGLLTIAPTGTLALSDLTGSIAIDIRTARPVPENGAWFTPGMIVLVDGTYEEESQAAGLGLGSNGGVGGTLGGSFVAFSIGGPPCERREVTLGVNFSNAEGDTSSGGGFGWIDFLGLGSEKACGPTMRKVEERMLGRSLTRSSETGRAKMVVLGEVTLDSTKTLQALKKVLQTYDVGHSADIPMTVILIGNFVQNAILAGSDSGGSIEYKEYFDALASLLSEFPNLLRSSTFVFVPGNNDPWASAFSAGAATVLPKACIPELYTSRLKKTFATVNAGVDRIGIEQLSGEAVWTTNPARIALFGPVHEIVVFRDDISSRLRRNALVFHSQEPTDNGLPDRIDTRPNARDADVDEVNRMDVDQAIEDTMSHVPGLKGEHASGSALASDTATARKLVKTILDQGYLSPFPISKRPVHWDYATALEIYPLPTSLVIVDPDAPAFAVTYEGCHVMNPARLVPEERRRVARWIEYDIGAKRGHIKEAAF